MDKEYDIDILRRIEDKVLNDPSLAKNGEGYSTKSEIKKFYKDQIILITGATGFLGKVLVEKLLRSCPEIQTIYILVRNKKGKDMHTRIDEVFEDPIFQVLKREQPKFRHKVVGVAGDISLPNLGLNLEISKKIMENVNIIFHAAATVKFDEKLKIAVNINIRGTKEILELAKQCKNLQSFVHISTAFSNCIKKEIEETFYTPPMQADNLIEMVEKMTEQQLEEITPQLIGEFPNTYAFTKIIAEDVVKQHGQGLPICLFRPSIVIATYREPIKGWSDNLYGPTGVLVGAGTGVLRSLHCDPEAIADIIPVDMCVNAIVTLGWTTTVDNKKRIKTDIPIYNYVSSCQAPITWGRFMELNRTYGLNYPTVKCLWYYDFTLNKYLPIHLFYTLLLHYLPALLMDTFCWMTGKKARMLKIYSKIHKFSSTIRYFTLQQWKFRNDNIQNLWKRLNITDRNIFNFDVSQIDWDEHSQTHIIGLRVYLVKDDLSTLPQARKKWARLRFLHRAIQLLTALVFLRIIYGVLNCVISTIF